MARTTRSRRARRRSHGAATRRARSSTTRPSRRTDTCFAHVDGAPGHVPRAQLQLCARVVLDQAAAKFQPQPAQAEVRGLRPAAAERMARTRRGERRRRSAQKNSRRTASPPPCSSTSSDEHGGEAATSCTSSVGAIAARAARDGVDDVRRLTAAAAWPACSPVDLVHWRHVASKYFGLFNQLFDFGCF